MSVRIAELQDVPILVELWKEFVRDHEEIALRENPTHKPFLQMKDNAADMAKDYMENQVQSDDALVLLVEVEGKPVGFSLIVIQNSPPIFTIDRMGVISDLYLKAEYRGRGLSSLMKEGLLSWLKEKSIKHVSIAFFAGNKHAQKVYQKWGFREYHIGMRRTI
jgi:GNAT superfamily N-acetyltransferase